MGNKLSISQKILLSVLYALIILILVFSIMASKNMGQEGYDNCVQNNCDTKGPEYCQKFRELNNCCLGSGGRMGQSQAGYVCTFS